MAAAAPSLFRSKANRFPNKSLFPKTRRGDKCLNSGGLEYANSKLFVLMFAKELQRRLSGTGVDVVAANPGVADTALASKMDTRHYPSGMVIWTFAKLFGQSPRHGVQSLLYAAMAPEQQGTVEQPPSANGTSFGSILS